MRSILIDNKKGPLPITVEFDFPGDSPVQFTVMGSGYSNNANELIGINIAIDGEQVGQSVIWSNGSLTHRATIPRTVVKSFKYVPNSPNKHSITISAMPNTVTDYNDYFTVIMNA